MIDLLTKLIDAVPVIWQRVIVITALLVGVAWAAEERYVPKEAWEKQYILELKDTIREIRKDLKDADLSEREREFLEEEIADLVDDLCYETDDEDRLCED